MKTFKELMEEKAITENLDEIQEMAYTEVQIICDNAKRIMDMMDEGIEPESWNYSKITLAADYLTTVYTAMRAKRSDMSDHGSYYEDVNLDEAKKILSKYADFHLEKSKETKYTEKHPQGAPIYNMFFDGVNIGKIVPYSGSIDKKKPGARIVSSRKYATLYSIEFSKEEKIPNNYIPVHSRLQHRTPKDALDIAALYYNRWLEKNEEVDLYEVTGGKVVATENGYPIHDMGANFPHKDKRFLIKDPIIDVWQASAQTLTDAKKKAKALKPAEGRGLGKRTDHADWSDEQKRRISSGEVRRAVMSRRSNSLYSESITDKDKVLVHSHKMGTDTGKYGVFNVEKVTSTHLTAHDHNTGKKIKFNLKSKRGIGDASELMIKKIMTEDVNLEESKLDDFRAKLIHRAVTEYADGKKDIRGVSVDKIADAFASKKNFGTKSQDELESALGLPIGVIKGLAKEVQAELKANFSGGSTSGQTQAQRIDRYLKQKWVK